MFIFYSKFYAADFFICENINNSNTALIIFFVSIIALSKGLYVIENNRAIPCHIWFDSLLWFFLKCRK